MSPQTISRPMRSTSTDPQVPPVPAAPWIRTDGRPRPSGPGSKRSSDGWRRRVLRGLGRLVRGGLILVLVVGVAVLGQRLGIDSVPAVIAAVLVGAGAALAGRRHAHSTRPVVVLLPAIVLLGVLASGTWSYTSYLSAAGAAPISVRTGDWMRDHGMNPIVDRLEQYLYAGTGPGNGKVAATQLPTTAVAHPARPIPPGALVPLVPPAAQPVLDPPLAGEGRWAPSVRLLGGRPVTYSTFLRPDPGHTNVVVAAVWLDPTATRVTYVPGTKQPGVWAWGSGVPANERPGLVAAFNAGFKLKDIPGGYRTEGRTPVPLVDGQASLVLHADGRADIGAWGSEVTMAPDVVSVRQNLEPIVDQGRAIPGHGSTASGPWGKVRWELQYTNRSGLGITADHALVYVSGSNLTTETLASALARLGAVRAMELDIHASNPTFNFFAPTPGGGPADVTGTRLVPSMKSSSDRFLAPDQRDFFAVTLSDRVGR